MALPAFRVAQTISGNAPFRKVHTTGGIVTKGAFLVLAAGGTVTAVADDAAGVIGLADSDAASGAEVVVVYATPDVIFSGNVSTGAPADTTDIGSLFSVDILGIDLNDTSGIAIVHGIDTTDSTVAAGTRVLFSIITTGFQGPGGVAV